MRCVKEVENTPYITAVYLPLIRPDPVSRDDLGSLGKNLVPSHLGQLSGYEYLPDDGDSGKNFWAFCLDSSHCTKISPLSQTNAKAQNSVGGLRKAD